MRILHYMPSGIYTDGHNYQENKLSVQNVRDGHEVMVIASQRAYENGNIVYKSPCRYVNEYGVEVVRVAYKYPLPRLVNDKLHDHRDIQKLTEEFHPDVMLFHGISSLDLKAVIAYKKKHPEVKLYCDNHAERANSATNWVSMNILHKGIYRPLLKKSLRYVEKILCVSTTCLDFLADDYKIDRKYLELYPLGGEVPDDEQYSAFRHKRREELGIGDGQILIIHSGKMDAKKKTDVLLKAFASVPNDNLRLAIIGSITDDIKSVVMPLIEKDSRVKFLGWKTGAELAEYLCAGDLYSQPGGQSAVLQNALCAHCAAVVYPHETYKAVMEDTVFYASDEAQLKDCISNVVNHPDQLLKMRTRGFKNAEKKFDYKILAQRLYRV